MRFTPRPDCQVKNLAEIYEAYLPDLGTFVEVGAFDGSTYSNTVFLAEMGWKGYYIEARPDFAEQCRINHANHLNITVIPSGVSDKSAFMDMYDIGECSTLVWDQTAINWGGDRSRTMRVVVHPLDFLLMEYGCDPGFDLLVVDVEHHEMEVLKRFNLNYWKPGMCIVETHEGQNDPTINFLAKPINEYFAGYGYKKIYFDFINTIFVR